jgi:adenylate kinase family enzyme
MSNVPFMERICAELDTSVIAAIHLDCPFEALEQYVERQHAGGNSLPVLDLGCVCMVDRRLAHRGSSGREDDHIEVLRKRFTVYQTLTIPLIEHYRQKGQLVPVNSNQEVTKVIEEMVTNLTMHLRQQVRTGEGW